VSAKEIIHEFYLLNIMRHLKSSHPFDRLVFKNKKNRSQSASAQKRPFSAKQRVPEGLTNEKIRESLERQELGEKYAGSSVKKQVYSGVREDKYGHYKNEVLN
jgi:hypothetical protein